jgi:uncharacterized protein (DUF1015 family)
MADIKPFQGILYDTDKVKDLKEVVTPPYDVISERQRKGYFDRHPQNVIRLILSKGQPQDTAKDNRYTRAAEFFHGWLDEGILIKDTEPALYLTVMDFVSESEARSRLGFIALVRLEEFQKGGILPHEKTFSATKADRMKLMEASKANFSPIFSLFSDPAEEIVGPLRACVQGAEPDLDFVEVIGYRHRLWRLTDQEIHKEISRQLAGKRLYIADGHHRYETALNYRNKMVARNGGLDPDDPCNFVMMYLTSMQDPGLILRSVHRMLCHVPQVDMDSFAEKAKTFFHVETLDIEADGKTEVPAAFLARIRTESKPGVMGVVVRGHRTLYILRMKDGIMDGSFDGEIPAAHRNLDVTIATKLVLQGVLGLNEAALDDEKRVLYTSRTQKAFRYVREEKCDIALILNPTKMSDVEEISNAGLIMPRKSTYFFPKVLSGLVMNKI